jgi:uncharacterized membrane protein/thiol-disulfide isomerase/thioredoxin
MKRHIFIIAMLLFALLFIPVNNVRAQTQPVVHAVLFYSPTCPHCEQVINETLPPLMQKYGSQLQIIGVDVTQEQGQTLFLAALDKFKLQDGGVPFLVIGDKYLMGSADIPAQLPDLIETYLTQGGVDFPDIPGLREAIPATNDSAPQTAPMPDSAPSASPSPTGLPTQTQLSWQDKFALDPQGNTLAILVLAGMIGAGAWTAIQFQQKTKKKKSDSAKDNRDWLIPILCVFGFGVAGYLAYVETAQVAAVCGPVGDCNTVQQSEYARLFGIIPIGIIGLAGYAAIVAAWLTTRYAKARTADLATVSMFGMAVLGTLFSIYLTFLEPFVIGATCAWCLTSAILITTLMLLSAKSAKAAFSKLKRPTISSS